MLNNLNDISRAEFYNKPIQVECLVSGKSVAPYIIPKRVTIQCLDVVDCGPTCEYSRPTILEVKANNEDILTYIDSSSHVLPRLVKKAFSIGCKYISCHIIEAQSLERLFISQPTGLEKNQWSQARQAFFVGDALDINTLYQLTGYSTVDPRNQTVTHVFTTAKKVKNTTELFIHSPKTHTRLKRFCLDSEVTSEYFAELSDLYHSYAQNLTKIHQRFLLHLAVDMVFHSVSDFNFDGEYVKKGWLDVMIIGDSSIGKGYVAESLIRYFGVGEVVSAELCSFAGLVGGMQKYNEHWVITWGKIPMNDRGMVVIDEGSNLIHTWEKLTRIRSEGVVEMTKIQHQITNARTRLLTLSNPVGGKTIANYSYGIQAILELVPSAEDIRRFDYVYVASNNEVPVDEINSSHKTTKAMHPCEDERDLIMWIWNTDKDHIEFTDNATKLIYKRAILIADMYDSQIPLIQAENVRIKLAKMAICFAGRFYSTKNKGHTLLVKQVHVDCATMFFHVMYKAEASGYYVYSTLRKEASRLFEERYLKNIDTYLKSFRSKNEVYRCLLQNNSLTVNDLIEHLSERKEIATEIISKLLQNNCIIRKGQYYVKTPLFTSWLKSRIINNQMKGL